MSRSPSQNTGMESPTMAKIIVMVSNHEYCLIAEMMPQGMPMRMAMIMAKAESFSV